MPLSTGQIVNGRYRIARLLGQGGMGAVYRAWDLTLNIPVALKEMIPEIGLDALKLTELRAQFRREAQALAGLAHPNLPRVSDFFEWEGNAYLVMDFVDGENLSDLIERQGAVPEASVVRWGLELLGALEVCHGRSILHRDIKPQNIIICPDGRAVLVDFGLVKLWDPKNPQTMRIIRGVGTREYASPEHFSLGGQHTDPRSDIYSLGATLYHALTGQEPPSALEQWTDSSPLLTPQSLGLRVRPEVERTILRAMSLDMAKRYETVAVMRAALQATVESPRPVQPHVASPQRIQPVAQASHSPARPAHPARAARVAPVVRHSLWAVEMLTAMGMALAGVLVLQVSLENMTVALYVGRSIGAWLLGGIGWFIGDLIFQALAKPEQSAAAASPGGARPTQRLVALTRRMTRNLSTAQQIGLLVVLLVGVAALVWLFGPLVVRLRVVWNYVPFYALIGPLAYAAAGRRPLRAMVTHTLVVTLGGLLLGARLGFSQNVLVLLLTAAAGGLLMEGIAFLAERLLIRRRV